MINVVFFAQLKETLKQSGLSLELATPCSVQQVKQALINQHPHWQQPLMNKGLFCAVNQTMVDSQHRVQDGDEVAFFPAVTGG